MTTRRTKTKDYVVLPFEQRSPTWKDWRFAGIGASDAPSIMGENRWRSRDNVLREKIWRSSSNYSSPAMLRGIELEPVALRSYEKHVGTRVKPACLQSRRFDWMLASVDGLSSDGSLVVEIKCGESTYTKVAESLDVPQYYYGQLQHILAVTGIKSIDFFCYSPDEKPICLEVSRDKDYIERLIDEEERFWQEVLLNRNTK